MLPDNCHGLLARMILYLLEPIIHHPTSQQNKYMNNMVRARSYSGYHGSIAFIARTAFID